MRESSNVRVRATVDSRRSRRALLVGNLRSQNRGACFLWRVRWLNPSLEKVRVTITEQGHSGLLTAGDVSPEVYESYLRGRFAAHNTRAELEKSIHLFEEAIRMDPTFAPAYFGLAQTYDDLSLMLVGAPQGIERGQTGTRIGSRFR